MTDAIPPEVQAYVEGIPAAHRPLFDRIHQLIMEANPGAKVTLSYQMPTYKAGSRRLYVAAWKHGISIYGWPKDSDDGFTERHPELVTSKGTIQLRPEAAERIGDDEFLGLARAALPQ